MKSMLLKCSHVKNQAVARMQKIKSLNLSPCGTASSTTQKFSVLPSATPLACEQPWAKLFLCQNLGL